MRRSKFPEVLKMTRVLPVLEKDKMKEYSVSYRPICHLHTTERVFEEHLKNELNLYLKTNNIIHENHHGGIAHRSRNTVKTLIDWHMNKAYENNKISLLISTDLSMAFDVVDHSILEEKMEYYGITGSELKFFKTYLKDRTQYVEGDTHKSRVRTLPGCSVIQGSKLSSILYTIYTNEIPALHKIMKDEEVYRELTGKEITVNNEVEHHTYNYVDDSNSCVIFNNANEIQEYVDNYFEILKEYHNLQKLKLNEDKTMLMIACQPKHKAEAKAIEIKEEEYSIKPQS